VSMSARVCVCVCAPACAYFGAWGLDTVKEEECHVNLTKSEDKK